MRFILAFILVCTFSFPSCAKKIVYAPHITAKRVTNGPFPSCTKPRFQSEAKYEAIDVKMVSGFILMQIKLIFTRKVLRLASFWK